MARRVSHLVSKDAANGAPDETRSVETSIPIRGTGRRVGEIRRVVAEIGDNAVEMDPITAEILGGSAQIGGGIAEIACMTAEIARNDAEIPNAPAFMQCTTKVCIACGAR